MSGNALIRAAFAAAILAGPFGAARADVTLIGTAGIPGDATDRSGLADILSGGVPHDRLGSFGSGIAWSGRGDAYYAIDDRGPADGVVPFHDRFQTLRIKVDPGAKPSVQVELEATTMLTRPDESPFIGFIGAIDPADWHASTRLDPEAIRVSSKNTIFVSDEYGPWIDEFDLGGRQLRRLVPPLKFLNAKAEADPDRELPPHARSGRQPNRGMEGLAISPDGRRLYGVMQSPLIQDGALDDRNKRVGLNIRIVEIDAESGGGLREFVYPLEQAGDGVNEILAVDDHRFLVLERDGKSGAKRKSCAIHLIDIGKATDVSKIPSLPAAGLSAGIQAASKRAFIDLLDSRFGLAGPEMPEKIEGMAFGPDLPDGRRTLVVSTDNDFKAEEPTRIWVFAVDAKDLESPASDAAAHGTAASDPLAIDRQSDAPAARPASPAAPGAR